MKHIFSIILLSLIALSACKTANTHLASDVKTGEYLGVIMTETKDFESKKIVYYEIENGKESFRKKSEEVNIYEP